LRGQCSSYRAFAGPTRADEHKDVRRRAGRFSAQSL